MHDGFMDTQERTSDLVLSTVQSALKSTGSKKVLVVGHSLGAAIASIDGMMLKMKLDPSIAITTTVFGLPRVGNKAWADLVDQTVSAPQLRTNASDVDSRRICPAAWHLVHARHEPRRPGPPRPANVPALPASEQRDPHHRRRPFREHRDRPVLPGAGEREVRGGKQHLRWECHEPQGALLREYFYGEPVLPSLIIASCGANPLFDVRLRREVCEPGCGIHSFSSTASHYTVK